MIYFLYKWGFISMINWLKYLAVSNINDPYLKKLCVSHMGPYGFVGCEKSDLSQKHLGQINKFWGPKQNKIVVGFNI